MVVTRLGCLLTVLLALSACTRPFEPVTSPPGAVELAANNPRNLGQEPRNAPTQEVRLVQPVSYCFNETNRTREEMQQAAEDFCRGGSVSYFGTDTHLRQCPLFEPRRITFICYPGLDN